MKRDMNRFTYTVCDSDFTFEHIRDTQSERFVHRPLRGFEGIFRKNREKEGKKEEERSKDRKGLKK